MLQTESTYLAEEIGEAGLEADPYPLYKYLQAKQPVCWAPAMGLWLVTRWDDVVYLCKHPDLFEAGIAHSPLTRTIGPNMLHSDGSYHDRLRAVLGPVFRQGALRSYPAEVIEPIAREVVHSCLMRGEADLMSEFARPLSLRVLKHILGIAVSDRILMRWSDGLAAGASNFTGDPERQAYADAISREIDEELTDRLDRPAEIAEGSATQTMACASVAGMLTREEIFANVKLLIIGGLKTAADLIGNALLALLEHPEQLREVLANPNLIERSIEEAVRWLSPVGTATRTTTRPCELSGTKLPAGAMVAGVLAAANRDPRVFTGPERFDIHRREGGHLAFAAGPHACIGALLGRYEGSVALRVLFDSVSTLQLDPKKPVEVRGWEFRAPVALNCVFERRGS